MKKHNFSCLFFLCIFLSVLFLVACQSINKSNAEAGIPPYHIIFSFDDGPNAHGDTTDRLLDILKKYEIKAMFTLLGENAEAYPDLVRRIYNEGHYIVNHGYSDKWVRGMGEEEFRNNLILTEQLISSIIGYEYYPKLYLPHSGFYSSSHKMILRETGYTMIPISVRAYDAVKTGASRDKIIRRIINRVEKQKGGIVLLHDGRDSHFRMKRKLEQNPHGAFNRTWIPEAVEEIILILLEKGYNLHVTSDLITRFIL